MSHIIRLTVIVVVALTVISCNEKRNKKQANNNAQQTEQSHPTLKGVDFKAPEYLSQDLAMQDLGGRVKSMQNTFYVCNPSGLKVEDEMGDEVSLFEFDPQGVMTKGFASTDPKEAQPKLVRNQEGQIEHIEESDPYSGRTIMNSFTFNPNGTISTLSTNGEDFNCDTRYLYTDGVLSKMLSSERGEVCFDEESVYTVIETDSHGNWTKRFLQINTTFINMATGQPEKFETSYGMEERYIVYYNSL